MDQRTTLHEDDVMVAIAAHRGGGEPEDALRAHPLENLLIAHRRHVVALIDDDDSIPVKKIIVLLLSQ